MKRKRINYNLCTNKFDNSKYVKKFTGVSSELWLFSQHNTPSLLFPHRITETTFYSTVLFSHLISRLLFPHRIISTTFYSSVLFSPLISHLFFQLRIAGTTLYPTLDSSLRSTDTVLTLMSSCTLCGVHSPLPAALLPLVHSAHSTSSVGACKTLPTLLLLLTDAKIIMQQTNSYRSDLGKVY